MMRARTYGSYWGFRGWKDLFYQWVPSFIYMPGKDRSQDLLAREGLLSADNTYEHITLIGDLFFRFGVLGAILGFMAIGFILAALSRLCLAKASPLWFVGLFELSALQLYVFISDFLEYLWVIFHTWLILLVITYCLMRVAGIGYEPVKLPNNLLHPTKSPRKKG